MEIHRFVEFRLFLSMFLSRLSTYVSSIFKQFIRNLYKQFLDRRFKGTSSIANFEHASVRVRFNISYVSSIFEMFYVLV